MLTVGGQHHAGADQLETVPAEASANEYRCAHAPLRQVADPLEGAVAGAHNLADYDSLFPVAVFGDVAQHVGCDRRPTKVGDWSPAAPGCGRPLWR